MVLPTIKYIDEMTPAELMKEFRQRVYERCNTYYIPEYGCNVAKGTGSKFVFTFGERTRGARDLPSSMAYLRVYLKGKIDSGAVLDLIESDKSNPLQRDKGEKIATSGETYEEYTTRMQ